MHIIVCIKSVVTAAPGGKIIRTPDRCALNPFDRPPLSVALMLKETHGGTITVVSMGPPVAEAALREAMAIGADRAVLLCDPALAGSDTLATAIALRAAATHLAPFDLLLFGMRSADSDTGQVGPQTAVLLDLPMVTGVIKVERTNAGLTVKRAVDGFEETYALTMPASLTVHASAAAARDPSLGGLAEAFDTQSVEMVDIGHLNLDPHQVGESGSPTRVLSMQPIHKERTCDWIEGTPIEQADSVVTRLVDAGLIG